MSSLLLKEGDWFVILIASEGSVFVILLTL